MTHILSLCSGYLLVTYFRSIMKRRQQKMGPPILSSYSTAISTDRSSLHFRCTLQQHLTMLLNYVSSHTAVYFPISIAVAAASPSAIGYLRHFGIRLSIPHYYGAKMEINNTRHGFFPKQIFF